MTNTDVATSADRSGLFTIGVLAKRSGASIETVRYYERIGLLPPPPRSAGVRRMYSREDLRILVFVRRARELGFGLEDIRSLLALGASGTCREVRDVAMRHLADIRSKLDQLQQLEQVLDRTVSKCSGRAIPECAVLDILDIGRDRNGKGRRLDTAKCG